MTNVAHRVTRGWTATLVILLALGLSSACGQGMEAPAESPTDTPAMSEPETSDEPRVASAPTAEDALPGAVLGTAPAPQGTALHYLSDDDSTSGYLALPEGEGPHPAVILVHEWDGLNDRVRQVADALAAEGYIALAADLYGGRTGSNREENMALVQEARGNMELVVTNLNTAAGYLRERDDTSGKIAVMGWCFGGGIALSYGLDGDSHEGTAMFYGQLVQDPEQLQRMTHEVYGSFAENDSGIPPAEVEKFAEALTAAGIENDIHVYDEVNHGFWLWVDQERETREAPALDAWQRLKAYLTRTLGD